jgi:predicted dithiol-disulfide oxidoreductase (DUF899 family)
MNITISDVTCPRCGAEEMHENGEELLQVRGYKVMIGNTWHSQCLVCSGGYDRINGEFNENRHDGNAGWFAH